MNADVIYLDNNATTAIDPRVAAVMADALASGPANPSSQHGVGRAAHSLVETALSSIAQSLHTDFSLPSGPRLIFTSGGTESNHLALAGLGDKDCPLIVSRIEHPSVLATAQAMQAAGRDVRWWDVDQNGVVDLKKLPSLLENDAQPKAGLVSLMSANNETGVLQPIAATAQICDRAGVALHIDATQTIGKLPTDLDQLGASAVTFTAHKFHGPAGIGALWINGQTKVRPVFHGGEQQLTTRPGTLPVALIIAMAEALRIATDDLQATIAHTSSLRDQLQQTLTSSFDELVINGGAAERLPGTTTSHSLVPTDKIC